MNLEEMKKDIDAFDRELFYGFSKFVLANVGEDKAGLFGKIISDINKELKKSDPKANLLTVILDTLTMYRENKLDETVIRNLYSTIVAFRSQGVIIHDNTAISSLKMEKLTLENENRQLASAYEIQSGELEAYKKFVALQGKTITGIL